MKYEHFNISFDCELQVGNYYYNKNMLALSLIGAKTNDNKYAGQHIATLTVNLGNDIGNDSEMPFCCAFVDTNNNPGAEKFIEENQLGTKYTRFGEPVYAHSGFCQCPLYSFDQTKLEALDPKGFAEYKKAYEEYLKEKFQ